VAGLLSKRCGIVHSRRASVRVTPPASPNVARSVVVAVQLCAGPAIGLPRSLVGACTLNAGSPHAIRQRCHMVAALVGSRDSRWPATHTTSTNAGSSYRHGPVRSGVYRQALSAAIPLFCREPTSPLTYAICSRSEDANDMPKFTLG
jgi:hypothetical protein